MLIVDLDKLQESLNFLREINETKLEDIIWADASSHISSIPVYEVEILEFKYTGLNNVDFARSYKGWVK